MRIHSNTLTRDDIRKAEKESGALAFIVTEHGSRKRSKAWEIKLSGDSPYRTHGNRDYHAATWDQWGVFLEVLFRIDEDMTTSSYDDHDHLTWVTAGRFLNYEDINTHRRHKWTYVGPSVTGTYGVHECECGATMRTTSPKTYRDIIAA